MAINIDVDGEAGEVLVLVPELTSAEEVLLGGGVGVDAGAPSGGAGEVLVDGAVGGLVGGSVGAVDGAVSGVLAINIDFGGEVEEVEVAGLVCGLLVGVDVFGASKGGHAAGVGAGSDVPEVGGVHALGGLGEGASSGGGGGEEGGGEFYLEFFFNIITIQSIKPFIFSILFKTLPFMNCSFLSIE